MTVETIRFDEIDDLDEKLYKETYIKIDEITEIHVSKNVSDNLTCVHIWIDDVNTYYSNFNMDDIYHKEQYELIKKELLSNKYFILSYEGDKDSEHIYNLNKIISVRKNKENNTIEFYKKNIEDIDYFKEGTEEYNILCKYFNINN